MGKNYVEKQIKRCNRNMLIVNLILLCLFTILDHTLYYNIVFGPINLDSKVFKTITTQKKLDNQYYYRVNFKNIFNAKKHKKTEYSAYKGLFEINTLSFIMEHSKWTIINKRRHNAIGYYRVLELNKKLLLVNVPNKERPKILIGALKPVEYELCSIGFHKKVESRFSKYMLVPTEHYKSELLKNFLNGFIFILFFLINIIRAIYRMFKPKTHPIYKKIKKYYGSPEETIISIDEEVNGNKVLRQKGKMTTPSWIIEKKFFTTKITRNLAQR